MEFITNRNLNIKIVNVIHRINVTPTFSRDSRNADGLVFYLKGSQAFEFSNDPQKHITGSKGDILYLPFRSSYKNNVYDPQTEYYQVDFVIYKDGLPSPLFQTPRLFTQLNYETYFKLFYQINQAYITFDLSKSFECFASILQLISLLTSQANTVDNLAIGRIKSSVEYINEFYYKNTTIKEIAAISSICISSLERLFKTCFGVTPNAYRNRIRIMHAKQLLLSGLTVEEVATAVGFYDSFHFSKTFKRLVGISPGEYARTKSFQ